VVTTRKDLETSGIVNDPTILLQLGCLDEFELNSSRRPNLVWVDGGQVSGLPEQCNFLEITNLSNQQHRIDNLYNPYLTTLLSHNLYSNLGIAKGTRWE
jgi:hypothetical protein